MNNFEEYTSEFFATWKSYFYGAWLGGSIAAVFDTPLNDWRPWVVILPTVLLVSLFNEPRANQE